MGSIPSESGNEYLDYIPGKCAYCGSSYVSKTLKSKIKGPVRDGYLWDLYCADCGSKWVALEKPMNDDDLKAVRP